MDDLRSELTQDELSAVREFNDEVKMARERLMGCLLTLMKLRKLEGDWKLSPDGKAFVKVVDNGMATE